MRMTAQLVATSSLVIVIVVHWIAQAKLYDYMRSRHAAAWEAAGSPTIWNVGMGKRFSYLRFVWLGGHRLFRDPVVGRSVGFMKSLDVFGLVLLTLGVSLAVL